MRKLIFPLVLLLLPMMLTAQGKRLDLDQRWYMNECLLDLLENKYERFSRLGSRSAAYSFKSMFHTESAPVFCDYIASSDYGKQIPMTEYLEYSQNLSDRVIRIRNLKKSDYTLQDGRWHVTLEFDKLVEYEDSLGFTFSTMSKEIGGDFHITMDCVWNDKESEFRIVSIDGKENSRSTFPQGDFHIVKQSDQKHFDQLLYGGEPIRYNEYGFAILPSGKDFDVADDDITLIQNRESGSGRYDIYGFSLTPKKQRVKLYITGSPFLRYTVTDNSQLAGLKPSSGGFGLGADYGFAALNISKSIKLAVYAGIGYSHGNISFNVAGDASNPLSQYSLSGVDYSIYGLKESIDLNEVTLKTYFSPEINLSKKVALAADIGLKLYLTAGNWNSDNYKLLYNDNKEYVTFSNFLHNNQKAPATWTLTGFAKIGADFAILPGMYVFFRIGAELQLPWFGLDNPLYVTDSNMPWQSLGESSVYPIYRFGNEDVAFHSLLDSISISRTGMDGEIGVKFKF